MSKVRVNLRNPYLQLYLHTYDRSFLLDLNIKRKFFLFDLFYININLRYFYNICLTYTLSSFYTFT